jgi:DNA-binding winged helix-turn-helix (wHTH) protein
VRPYNSSVRIRFGDFVFDSHLRALARRGNPIDLAPKAYQLLEALIEARPAPVTKDALYERLWPKTFVEPGNLHNLIADIREALGDKDHETIRTIHRVGYAFAATTREQESGSRLIAIVGTREFPLVEGENLIGRDPDCRIVINSPDVSRHHARIILNGPSVAVEDLCSKNGTFVGTTRAAGVTTIAEGDDLIVGRTRLLLRAARELSPTATAG